MSRIINVSETLELNPTGYTGLSNLTTTTSYPVSNGYHGSDNTTYARFTLSSGSTGYLYYTFDTSGIPSGATINSIACSVRARVSSTSRVTSTSAQLYSGTTAKGSSKTFASTSTTNTFNLTCGTWTLEELSDLRLRIGGTGSSSSGGSSRYIYFHGATVTISYSLEGTAYTVTATSNVSGVTVDPASQELLLGSAASVRIDASSLDGLSITDNGTDVLSSLTQHEVETGGTETAVLGTYTLVSGGFNGSGATYFSGIVGNGVNATQTSSNYYSSSSSTNAVFTYAMGVSLPSNATVTAVSCQVNGHAESTSQSNEYMCVQLKSGSTEISSQVNFKSIGTSNTTTTLTATTIPTVAQLESLVLECTLGYYGGAINGATLTVEYTVPQTGNQYYWTYDIASLADDHAIVISQSGGGPALYVKDNGVWVEVTAAYKKVSGVWQLISIDQAFDSQTNYTRSADH